MADWQRTDDEYRIIDDAYVCTPGEPVMGRALRVLLVTELDRLGRSTLDGSVTVAELERSLAAAGVRFAHRPSKAISDALRWEIGRNRVARIGRGRYRFTGAPDSTMRRIRRQARAVYRQLG